MCLGLQKKKWSLSYNNSVLKNIIFFNKIRSSHFSIIRLSIRNWLVRPLNLPSKAKLKTLRQCSHRFVEETVVGVLVLLVRAVIEAVTERPIVNTAEPASPVRPGTCEPLHVVRRPRALWKPKWYIEYYNNYTKISHFLSPCPYKNKKNRADTTIV